MEECFGAILPGEDLALRNTFLKENRYSAFK
jgi:hypothetical protein